VMSENKAQELLKQANKKSKAYSFFSNSNKEESVELFDKAAAQFKINKDWKNAAEAYLRAAEVSIILKNELEACTFYNNAAKAYKNVSSAHAVKAFKECVQLHMDTNRFSSAAKIYQQIAELEEKEDHIPAAVEACEKAAECYAADGDSTTSGNQMLLKIAHFAAQGDEYKKAIEIFEKVAIASLDNRLLQYSVKDYLFKASLCHLVMAAQSGDVSSMQAALDKYKDMQPAFDGSRECKLVESCLAAFQEDNVNKFTDVVFNYDKIYKLDNWISTLLLKVKQSIQGQVPQKLENSNSKNHELDLQGTVPQSASSAYAAKVDSNSANSNQDQISFI